MDVFIDYLHANTQLNEAEIQYITSMAAARKLRRNEFLLREGEVCRHKTFIEKGMLRNFGITADGNEHILQFSPANSWTLEVESYDHQTPAKFNIDAIEPTEVLLWAKADFDHVLATFPELKRFSERLIAQNVHNSRRRLLIALGATPEEKYEDFVHDYPELLSRLPLRMIASYLGISIKTLTRLRHAQLAR